MDDFSWINNLVERGLERAILPSVYVPELGRVFVYSQFTCNYLLLIFRSAVQLEVVGHMEWRNLRLLLFHCRKTHILESKGTAGIAVVPLADLYTR